MLAPFVANASRLILGTNRGKRRRTLSRPIVGAHHFVASRGPRRAGNVTHPAAAINSEVRCLQHGNANPRKQKGRTEVRPFPCCDCVYCTAVATSCAVEATLNPATLVVSLTSLLTKPMPGATQAIECVVDVEPKLG